MLENDDSSDDEPLSKQVLPTADDRSAGPIDMTKMPTTGEEYLRQVRYQASRLPDFRTATDDRRRIKESTHTKKHPWHRLFSDGSSSQAGGGTTTGVALDHSVSMDWQNEQCASFSDVRNAYFPMRDRLRRKHKSFRTAKLKSPMNYWKFCFGPDVPFQSALSALDGDDSPSAPIPLPTMTKIIVLTQSQLYELLQHQTDWLKQGGCSTHLALYMFATLVAIEKPISEDVIYAMRQACLAWKQMRAKLLVSNDTLIKSCDLFVCLIGRYFGQFDLADTINEP